MGRSVIHSLPDRGGRDRIVVQAAGGVLLRRSRRRRLEVATVFRKGRNDWSLPKGKLEPGESLEECAVREVVEETGYDCVLGPFAGCTEYHDRRGRPKEVAYWYMDPAPGSDFHAAPVIGTDEIDDLRWLELTVACRALSYPHDQELLSTLGRQAEARFA